MKRREAKPLAVKRREARPLAVKALISCLLLSVSGALATSACVSPSEPQSSSQTNWYRRCRSDAECGDLECLCGACSARCSQRNECREDGSVCLTVSDERAATFCEGVALMQAVCAQSCDGEDCPEGTSCKAGVCQVLPTPDSLVTIDLSGRYQTLIGFGASLAYAERDIVGRDDQDALYDALFSELGVDTIRLVNHFEPGREAELETPAQIIEAATDRLGGTPTLLMTSGSPPAGLKANGTKLCDGSESTCTLAKLEDGSFNYQGFAEFWRDALEAYRAVGIEPDFVSIQNNPNWSPPEGSAADACRFLPVEGTTTIEGQEVEFPGYVEAARAVRAAWADLEDAPPLFGPETTSLEAVPRYEPVFAAGLLSSVAVHLYGTTTEDPRTDAMNAVRALATYYGIPLIQSEMMAEGLQTAVLIHHVTVEANAAAYLQNDFISRANALNPNQNALIRLETSGFVRQSAYYALQHFARRTEAGWVRVGAHADGGGLLASAWISPGDTALTLILINPTQGALRTQIDLGELRGEFGTSDVAQTIFRETVEHRELGKLSEDGLIEIPGQAALTVALSP